MLRYYSSFLLSKNSMFMLQKIVLVMTLLYRSPVLNTFVRIFIRYIVRYSVKCIGSFREIKYPFCLINWKSSVEHPVTLRSTDLNTSGARHWFCSLEPCCWKLFGRMHDLVCMYIVHWVPLKTQHWIWCNLGRFS